MGRKMSPWLIFIFLTRFYVSDLCAAIMYQIFVIPVLIGLLFELLVIVPMRVPVDESPVFLLYQDWALGLIFLKIWTRLVSNYHYNFLDLHQGFTFGLAGAITYFFGAFLGRSD